MTNGVMPSLLAAALMVAAASPGMGAAGSGDPLAAYRGKARIVVAVASDPSDPKLLEQRAIFARMKAGATERDLVLVEAAGASPEAASLRRTFGLGDGFHAVLIGKDGGDKLTSAEPLGAEQLFPLIDSMPMRQDEMKQR